MTLAMAAFVTGLRRRRRWDLNRSFRTTSFRCGRLNPRTGRSTASTCPRFRALLIGRRSPTAASDWPGSRQFEGSDQDARFQSELGGAKAASIPHGAHHFVAGAARRSRRSKSSNRMRRSRTTRSRRCSTPRRRQPHRPAVAMSPKTRPSPTWAGHAAGDRTPLRQAADHLYDRRFL